MTYSDLSQPTPDERHSISRRVQFSAATAALLALVVLAVAPRAGAAAINDSEELSRVGSGGSGAGQLRFPGSTAGIASDAATGHFYAVEESPNFRVSEFTAWGKFVKAFGWDVAPGPVNEQQEVRVRAATGQFKLSLGAETTADLDFDAEASEVEAALESLAAIGAGDAGVEAVPGNVNGVTPFIYVVTFKGSLAASNVAQLTISNGATTPSGGVPTTHLVVRTRADGTPGGTGLESCTEESGCKAGLSGGGRGQLASAAGIAIDAAGNLYVREVGNLRVQKFDSAGHFLSMFGGDVNKTKVEEGAPQADRNVCPIDPADVCQAGSSGAGDGQFLSFGFPGGITLCSGALFAADKDRIQRFNLEGEFGASVPVPGETVQSLACDPIGGDLYAAFQAGQNAHRLDPVTGEEVDEIEAPSPRALATDSLGDLFVASVSSSGGRVLQFNSAGNPLSPPSCCETPPSESERVVGLGTNTAGNLHVGQQTSGGDNFIRILGPAPVSFEAAPQVPPEISAQFASSVGRNEATVAAEINPHFWTDTRYYVQYGTGKCSEGGCEETKPLPPGALLTSKVTDDPIRSAGVSLEGLQPATTYHYRFVAESLGGGPVRGVGGEVGLDGEESSFTTYPAPPPPKADCPNQQFRTGFSAPLPDCRAYEMVSPVDKNNGDIQALLDTTTFSTALSQSAADGERFTYSSFRGFSNPKGAPYTNQYLASRRAGIGWANEALAPAQPTRIFDTDTFENAYKAFSADLCTSWLVVTAEPALALGAPGGFRNVYRRSNCGEEGYEALIGVKPNAGEGKFNFYPSLQGISADGEEAVFAGEYKLTEDGASGGTWQAYYASEGQLHLLCVLPDGSPSGGNCSAGTGPLSSSFPEQERFSSVTNAISEDGSKVYWTDSGDLKSGPGKVYLRLNPGKEQSEIEGGECSEPEKACTLEVSEAVTGKDARFLDASADGLKALFELTEGTQKGNLYKYDFEAAESTLIAKDSLGVAGTSKDFSHAYFVSEEALAETSGATAGKPNLYLDQEGTKTFIATISKEDAVARKPSDTTSEPIYRAARVTADGSHLAFISTERLTGYDNTDQLTGKAAYEVYLYEAGSAGPVCVSCNPSGARPLGRLVLENGNFLAAFPTASALATPDNQLYFPRTLSADGESLFFNSFDPLLLRDTNGKGDVYQWQSAQSQKGCEERGAELYVPSSEGCLSLISTGQSPSDSEFLDASPSGDDVFFTTAASLLPQDPGLVDVYDARANGGLPPPPAPPGPCQGEACQFAPPPPNDSTPASASFRGAGNPGAKPRARCAKGKARRKGRCVAKRKRNNAKRAANNNRRASR